MAPLEDGESANRQNILESILHALNKLWKISDHSHEEPAITERYIILKMEDIYIFVDCELYLQKEHSLIFCSIVTGDLAAYILAREMVISAAYRHRVGVRFTDEDAFRLVPLESSQRRVRNPIDGKGIFWNCCGCYCLEDTEEEQYNWETYFPLDDGYCSFHNCLAAGKFFEPECQRGKEIIASTTTHYPLQPASFGVKSIF